MTGSEDTSVIVWDIKTQVVKTRLWWAKRKRCVMQAHDWWRAYNLLHLKLKSRLVCLNSTVSCIAPKRDLWGKKKLNEGMNEWMLWEKRFVPPADDDRALFSARYSGSSG